MCHPLPGVLLGDLARLREQEYPAVTVYGTVAEALRCGGDTMAVDAVLLIGECAAPSSSSSFSVPVPVPPTCHTCHPQATHVPSCAADYCPCHPVPVPARASFDARDAAVICAWGAACSPLCLCCINARWWWQARRL